MGDLQVKAIRDAAEELLEVWSFDVGPMLTKALRGRLDAASSASRRPPGQYEQSRTKTLLTMGPTAGFDPGPLLVGP